jgi:hypothetical protein
VRDRWNFLLDNATKDDLEAFLATEKIPNKSAFLEALVRVAVSGGLGTRALDRVRAETWTVQQERSMGRPKRS